ATPHWSFISGSRRGLIRLKDLGFCTNAMVSSNQQRAFMVVVVVAVSSDNDINTPTCMKAQLLDWSWPNDFAEVTGELEVVAAVGGVYHHGACPGRCCRPLCAARHRPP
ncbi:unnamed protein product, partial [Polarella glacialis]